MVKMTAVFDMQDKIQSKIDKLTNNLKKMDKQAKSMQDMEFKVRLKDDVTRNATRIQRALTKDFAKSYAISVGINDKALKGAKSIANFMEKNMPKTYSISVNVADHASKKIAGIGKLLDKKIPKAYYTEIDANGKPFEVTVNRLMNYLRRKNFKKYEVVLTAKDTVTETVKKAAAFTKKLFSKGYSVTITAIDKLTSTAARIGSKIKSVLPSMINIPVRALNYTASAIGAAKRALFSLPTLFTITIGAVLGKSFYEATVKSSATFEEYTVSMTHWLKSADKAKEYMSWIGQYADSTPFSSADLMPAAARATGLTKNRKEFEKLMKLSVDMAALTPGKTVAESMEALADAQMGEFERLKEFNMKYTKESMDAAGGFNGFIEDAQEKFSGGAKGFSQAYSGMISTIKGYTGSFFRSIGDGFQTAIKPRLAKVIKWLEENQDAWTAWKETAVEAGSEVANWIGEKFDGLFNYIGEKLKSINEWRSYGTSVTNIFKQLSYEIGQDINDWLYKNGGMEQIKEFFSKAGSAFGSAINAFITGVLFSSEVKGGEVAESMGLVDIMANVGGEAAKSFGKSFIDSLDPGALIKQIFTKLLEINTNGLKSVFGKMIGDKELEDQGNIWGTLLADGLLLGFALRFKGIRVIIAAGLKPLGKLAGKGLKGIGKKGMGKIFPSTMKVDPTKATRAGRYSEGGLPGTVSKFGKFMNKTGALGKGLKGLGSVAKRIPVLGTVLSATSLIGINKNNAGEKIGDFGGGAGGMAAGAAGGAAIGSIIPGIGTAIGGVIGSIIGGIAGSELGQRIGKWIQNGPLGKAFIKVKDFIAETLFDGGWWSEKWSDVTSYASEMWTQFKEGWSNITSWVGEKIGIIGGFFSNVWKSISDTFGGIVEWFDTNIWTPIYNAAVDKINFIVGVFAFAWEIISLAWSGVVEWFTTNIWEPIKSAFTTVGTAISNAFSVSWIIIQTIWFAAVEWFTTNIWEPIKSAFTIVGTAISNAFTVSWLIIQTIWFAVVEWFTTNIWVPLQTGAQVIGEAISGFFQTAHDAVINAWTGVTEWFNKNVKDPIVEVAEKISSAFEEAFGWISDVIGKAGEAANSAKDWIGDKAGGVKNFFTEIGEDTTGLKKKKTSKNATGGLITQEQLSWIGEGGKKEFIIPVDQNVGRGKMLLGAAANALGVDMGGQQSNTVNNVIQMPSAPQTSSAASTAMTTTLSAEAVENPELATQGAMFGNQFATALGTGINQTVISMQEWKNRNINTPMMTLVAGSTIYGSDMVNQFAAGQNATATGTDGFINTKVRQPFINSQTQAAGWGQVLVGNFRNGMTSEGNNVEQAAKDLAKRVEDAFRAELDIHSPSRVMRKLGQYASIGVVKGLSDVDVKKYAENQAGSLAAAFSGMGAVGGNVQEWLMAAMMATGVPLSWLGPLSVIAQHESGGNPGAVNNWDSNAAKGTPSMGLMQTIMPTFQSNMAAGMGNILNPIHNAAAAINYIKSRYGNVFNVPGIKSMAAGGAYRGYRTGGVAKGPQVATLAEKGWKEFIIPTEPGMGARSDMLLRQAANHFGYNLVSSNDTAKINSTTVSPEIAQAANGTQNISTKNGDKVVTVNFNGDNHFANNSDMEDFEGKVVSVIRQTLKDEDFESGDGVQNG
ncbi:transglycosylase SLT domain-containing protein [Listeria seeligeri]|nr:transglycosylase SLT domain-containing protein [Listeria seeligeri]